MNIESKHIHLLLAAVLLSACGETKPTFVEEDDRRKTFVPTLTSTAPSAPMAPIEPPPPVFEAQEPSAESGRSGTVKVQAEAAVGEMLDAGATPVFEPKLGSVYGLAVRRLVTTSAVERREPVGSSSVFGHHDEKVYAFVEMSNDSEEDKTLLVHFIGPEGQVSGGITLRIPGSAPRWRTWAYTKRADRPGIWRVEIRTPDGTLLGALPFEVEPGC